MFVGLGLMLLCLRCCLGCFGFRACLEVWWVCDVCFDLRLVAGYGYWLTVIGCWLSFGFGFVVCWYCLLVGVW